MKKKIAAFIELYFCNVLLGDQGQVEVTIAGGRIVWENGELKAVPGTGKYVKMPRFSYVFDGIDKADSNYLASLRAPVKRFRSSTWLKAESFTFSWCTSKFKAIKAHCFCCTWYHWTKDVIMCYIREIWSTCTINYGSGWLGGGAEWFSEKIIFQFPQFDTAMDGKLFFKENNFPFNGGKWFVFRVDGKLIFFVQLFDNMAGQNIGVVFNFNVLDRNLSIW